MNAWYSYKWCSKSYKWCSKPGTCTIGLPICDGWLQLKYVKIPQPKKKQTNKQKQKTNCYTGLTDSFPPPQFCKISCFLTKFFKFWLKIFEKKNQNILQKKFCVFRVIFFFFKCPDQSTLLGRTVRLWNVCFFFFCFVLFLFLFFVFCFFFASPAFAGEKHMDRFVHCCCLFRFVHCCCLLLWKQVNIWLYLPHALVDFNQS